ncbi:hypothetical protein AD998_13685 [bacterium 336/3]|nr:hypothetical protein AD998_13685 [bacterium 336/3]
MAFILPKNTVFPDFSKEELESYGLMPLQQKLTEVFLRKITPQEFIPYFLEHKEILIGLLLPHRGLKGRLEYLLQLGNELQIFDIFLVLYELSDLQDIEKEILKIYQEGKILLPSNIIVKNTGSYMDGGSMGVCCTNLDTNKDFNIFFQHYNWTLSKNPQMLSGAIYYDGWIVPIRSPLETQILQLLEDYFYTIRNNLEKEIVSNYLNFIRSDDYLELARVLGRLEV